MHQYKFYGDHGISASSRTPPNAIRTYLRPVAFAIDWPSEVLPTLVARLSKGLDLWFCLNVLAPQGILKCVLSHVLNRSDPHLRLVVLCDIFLHFSTFAVMVPEASTQHSYAPPLLPADIADIILSFVTHSPPFRAHLPAYLPLQPLTKFINFINGIFAFAFVHFFANRFNLFAKIIVTLAFLHLFFTRPRMRFSTWRISASDSIMPSKYSKRSWHLPVLAHFVYDEQLPEYAQPWYPPNDRHHQCVEVHLKRLQEFFIELKRRTKTSIPPIDETSR